MHAGYLCEFFYSWTRALCFVHMSVVCNAHIYDVDLLCILMILLQSVKSEIKCKCCTHTIWIRINTFQCVRSLARARSRLRERCVHESYLAWLWRESTVLNEIDCKIIIATCIARVHFAIWHGECTQHTSKEYMHACTESQLHMEVQQTMRNCASMLEPTQCIWWILISQQSKEIFVFCSIFLFELSSLALTHCLHFWSHILPSCSLFSVSIFGAILLV